MDCSHKHTNSKRLCVKVSAGQVPDREQVLESRQTGIPVSEPLRSRAPQLVERRHLLLGSL